MKKILWFILLLLSITACKNTALHIAKIKGTRIPVDSTMTNEPVFDSIILPYKLKLEKDMSTVLAYSPADLYKSNEKAETNIGNFMADLCYKRGNTIFKKQTGKDIDFCLLNYGGIRAGIPKGDVTIRNAYQLMPFENSMVVAELSYDKLQELFNYLATSSNAHPISKQLHLVIDQQKITESSINGKKLDKNKNYYVLTSDYLQHGGDRMNFFKDPVKLYNLKYKIRTAIIDELTAIDTIKAVTDGRIIRK